jgi:hypothetical protein
MKRFAWFAVFRPAAAGTRDQMLLKLSREFCQVVEAGSRFRPTGMVTNDRSWDLGHEAVALRDSIHSNAWTGTAVKLASSNLVMDYALTSGGANKNVLS